MAIDTRALLPQPRSAAARRRPGPSGPQGRGDSRRPAAAKDDLHHRFAELLLAVLTGKRPASALLGRVSPAVYDQVWELAQSYGGGGPATTGPRPGSRAATAAPRVLRCRRCSPRPGVAEAAAVVWTAGRARALAFRLERGQDGRWRCTALQTA